MSDRLVKINNAIIMACYKQIYLCLFTVFFCLSAMIWMPMFIDGFFWQIMFAPMIPQIYPLVYASMMIKEVKTGKQ